MSITSKTEIHSIRDSEAPKENEIAIGDVKNKEKTVAHNLTDHNQNTLSFVGTELMKFIVKKVFYLAYPHSMIALKTI